MLRTDEETVDELLAKYGFGPASQHQARPNNGNGHGGGPSDQPHAPPLKWLDMSNWDREPVPERKWAIRDRVPAKQAGLFSGEGGVGKSIIELKRGPCRWERLARINARTGSGFLHRRRR
jgi:hypothetical protein